MEFHLPTFLLQTINFLVLVFVLWRLLWRPLRNHMEKRQERIAQGLTKVDEERKQLEAMSADAEAKLESARRAESEAIQRAERDAETRRAAILESAHREAAEERDRLLGQVGAEQRRRENEFVESLDPTIMKIVERIVSELAGPLSLHEAACMRLSRYIEELPEAQRGELRDQAKSGVEIQCANGGVPASLEKTLAELLPPDAKTVRATRTELLAGARIVIGDRVLDGSVGTQIHRALEAT